MALQKQNFSINFAQGLDTKTDPFQVGPGKFLQLDNSVFSKGGQLLKRNGYTSLGTVSGGTFVTTLNSNLLGLGSSLYAYSSGNSTLYSQGSYLGLSLATQSMVRLPTNLTSPDSVTASNGLSCIVFVDSANTYKYSVVDTTTGQSMIGPTLIPAPSGATTDASKVFLLGSYFVIVLNNVVGGTNHLQYFTIHTTTLAIGSNTDLSTSYNRAAGGPTFDGAVVGGKLYLAWNGNDGGGAVRITSLDTSLVQGSTVVFATFSGIYFSVCGDITVSPNIIYVSFYNNGSNKAWTCAVNASLTTIFAPVQIMTGSTLNGITSVAQSGSVTVFQDVLNHYTYDALIATDTIVKVSVSQAGSVGSTTTVIRSLGLNSKAFLINGNIYMMAGYTSIYQPTAFVIDSLGSVIGRLAYQNNAATNSNVLPSVTVNGTSFQVCYLIRDLIQAISKASATLLTPIYSQTGINLAKYTLTTQGFQTVEIANALLVSGGMTWLYDGRNLVEHQFHLYPDFVEQSTSGAGGSMTAQTYNYKALYEWTDNQGNIHRSAPSLPVSTTTTGATSSVTINVPTLRATNKTNVRIVIYRSSTAQATYYQITSITSPLYNDTTVDYKSYVDTVADSAILGNAILYTTGGVVEDIAPPAPAAMALYRSRAFIVPAEDPNTLWYSKQIIEATPVEFSDLFTIYTPATQTSSNNSGGTNGLFVLDDKLILFKKNGSIYYLVGNGPDNTGANNDFSEPVFINSNLSLKTPASFALIPNGLIFQTDKGFWLLGRDLSTQYIGAPVEQYNSQTCLWAQVIPGTNQVRFGMDSYTILVYDYFYNQWSTFSGISAVSSTIYNSLHTVIDTSGRLLQETSGSYLDISTPVTMTFKTGWFNFATMQGLERAYFMSLLGTYITPHTLTIDVYYDYSSTATQTVVITPDSTLALEQWEIFFKKQKCQAFQLRITEAYNSGPGIAAGAGLTLSGIDLTVGTKSTYPRLGASMSTG